MCTGMRVTILGLKNAVWTKVSIICLKIGRYILINIIHHVANVVMLLKNLHSFKNKNDSCTFLYQHFMMWKTALQLSSTDFWWTGYQKRCQNFTGFSFTVLSCIASTCIGYSKKFNFCLQSTKNVSHKFCLSLIGLSQPEAWPGQIKLRGNEKSALPREKWLCQTLSFSWDN